MRTLTIFLLVVWDFSPALSDKSSEAFIIQKSISGMTTYIRTEGGVYHMEMDQYLDGNILYSDGAALKTTDGNISETIAGQSTNRGYREGVGEAAKFSVITGFYQISSRKVVVVDNSCLRIVVRPTGQTQQFSGSCTKFGYSDESQALFNNPWSIIPDNQDHDKLLVTDENNMAVRHVGVESGAVSTFFIDVKLHYPRGITQEVASGDLFMASRFSVYHLHYQDKELTLMAGSPKVPGFIDGDFYTSRFDYLREVLLIDKGRKLLVADGHSHRLRVLARDTNITHSLCSGASGNTDKDMVNCLLNLPYSLMVSEDSLFIGEATRIRKLSGLEPRAMAPTTPRKPFAKFMTTTATAVSTTVSSELPITISSPCSSENITKQLLPGEKTADVEIVPGHSLQLPAGEYIHKMTSQPDNCTAHITIIEDLSYRGLCSVENEHIISSLSGEGGLDIACGDVIHRLNLPIGEYKYDNCSTTVKVTDNQVVRRLSVKSEYNIRCALLSDPITKSMVMSVAESHSTYIDGPTICGKVCKRQKDGDIKLTCVNDSLSILWPTDQTYSGDVIVVPSSVHSVIGPRLRQFGSQTFEIFIMKLQPPVVRPVKTDVVLVSSCLNNKMYVEDTDSCV